MHALSHERAFLLYWEQWLPTLQSRLHNFMCWWFAHSQALSCRKNRNLSPDLHREKDSPPLSVGMLQRRTEGNWKAEQLEDFGAVRWGEEEGWKNSCILTYVPAVVVVRPPPPLLFVFTAGRVMPLQWQLGSVCDVKVVGDASSSLITRILRGIGAILHDLRTQLTPLVPEECRREKTYFFFVLSFLSFLFTISVALYHFASSRISVVFRSQVVFWLLTDRTRWQTSISDIKTKTPGSQWLRWRWWLWWWWWASLRFLWWLCDKGDLRNCLWLICQSKPTDGRFTPLCPTQSIEGPQYRRDRDLWLRDLLAGDRDSQRLGWGGLY